MIRLNGTPCIADQKNRRCASAAAASRFVPDIRTVAISTMRVSEAANSACSPLKPGASTVTTAGAASAMIREGRELAKLHKNVVVKCPLIREGIKATSVLSKEGIRTDYWNWGKGFISAYPPDQFIMLEKGATYGAGNHQITPGRGILAIPADREIAPPGLEISWRRQQLA